MRQAIHDSTRMLARAAGLCLLMVHGTLAATRERGSTHPEAEALRADLATTRVSVTLDDVDVRDVAKMLSRIAGIFGDGVKCAPLAGSRRVSLKFEDAPVLAVLEETCVQADLYWRIEPDTVFVFTEAESKVTWAGIKAERLQHRPTWPGIPMLEANEIFTRARAGKLQAGQYVHSRTVEGWTFSWRLEAAGTNFVLMRDEARIEE